MAITYNYKIDSFRIVKVGFFEALDTFADNNPPPSTEVVPLPGTQPFFFTSGGFDESGGRAVMNSANDPMILPVDPGGPLPAALHHQAIFNNIVEPGQSVRGLQRHHSFFVEGVFDLDPAQIATQHEFGVRFIDFATPAEVPGHVTNDYASLSVRRGTDGVLRVELSERVPSENRITVLSHIDLDATVIGSADQIRLRLTHEADTDVVTGSFEMVTGGVPWTTWQLDSAAHIYGSATATTADDENWTRPSFFTTNFDTEDGRSQYRYDLDRFSITRNGQDYFIDDFNDGVRPPATNNTAGTVEPLGQYAMSPNAFISESSGVAILDSFQAQKIEIDYETPGGTIRETSRVHSVLVPSDMSASSTTGLKISHDFEVKAVFYLAEPMENRSEYGIRLSDFVPASPGAPLSAARGGDDVVSLSVRRGTETGPLGGQEGVVRVQLTDRNLKTGAYEVLASSVLDIGTADQIELVLTHDNAQAGVIRGGYRLFDHGVEIGFVELDGFGRIFGTDTKVTTDNETWTRAGFFSTGFDEGGVNLIDGTEEHDFLGDGAASGEDVDNTFLGYGGDDHITPSGGDDVIDGGSGFDMVVYDGWLYNYQVERLSDGSLRIQDLRAGSPNGVDIVRNVEVFHFSTNILAEHLLSAEIEVFGSVYGGGQQSMQDGDKTTRSNNGTDFGTAVVGDTVIHTFDVTNYGYVPLTTAVKLPKGFVLVEPLSASIAPGQTDTFQVRLDTSKAGVFTGPIVITTNDPNERSFDFAIKGTVLGAPPPTPVNGDGSDNVFLATSTPEAFFGFGGNDTVSYENASAGVIASLLTPVRNTGLAANDLYDLIEHLIGSDHADALIGNTGNNVLEGGAGGDILDGGAGSDTASYAHAAAGVSADLQSPALNLGDAAGDSYKLIENLLGSDHADDLWGNKGINVLSGGDGDDTLTGRGGQDSLFGGFGADLFGYLTIKDGGDIIHDFAEGEDVIGIVKSGFKIDPAVALGSGDAFDFALHYFVSNTTGQGSEFGHGQFVFNQDTDQLLWDADGAGKKTGVVIATFATDVNLLASDFFLV